MTSHGWSIAPKLRDGQYLLKYKDPRSGAWRQHRMPVEVSTRRDAERYAKRWYETFKAELEKPSALAIPRDNGPTVAELANKWLVLRRQLLKEARIRPATLKQDLGCLNHHILPAFGELPVCKLGSGELRRFLRALSSKRATSTVRNVASVMKAMLDDIIAEEDWAPALKINPMRNKGVRRQIPSLHQGSSNRKTRVPMHDIEALLRSPEVPDERKVRYVLATTAGCRDGELGGFRWTDFTVDGAQQVSIERSMALVGGLQEPKTLNGRRTIPLHPLTVEVLRWWHDEGWERWVGRKPRSSDFVLPDRSGRPWRPRSGSLLRADLKAAGCPTESSGRPITFHALRRTFSSTLEDNPTVKPLTKRVLMGHALQSVDELHYAEASMAAKTNAILTIKLCVSADEVIGAAP